MQRHFLPSKSTSVLGAPLEMVHGGNYGRWGGVYCLAPHWPCWEAVFVLCDSISR